MDFMGVCLTPPEVNGHFNGQPKPALLLPGPGLISNGFTHTFIAQMNNSLRWRVITYVEALHFNMYMIYGCSTYLCIELRLHSQVNRGNTDEPSISLTQDTTLPLKHGSLALSSEISSLTTLGSRQTDTVRLTNQWSDTELAQQHSMGRPAMLPHAEWHSRTESHVFNIVFDQLCTLCSMKQAHRVAVVLHSVSILDL